MSPQRRNDGEEERIQKDPRVLGEHSLAYLPIRTRVHGGARVKTMKRRLDNFARVPWIFSGATRARAGRARVLSRAMTARVPPRTRRKIFRTRRQSSSPVKRASRAPGPFAPADNYVTFHSFAKQNKKKMSLAKRKSSSAWTPSESVALEAGVKAHGASEYPPLFKPEPPPIAAAWKRVPPADPPSPENG